MEEGLGLFLFLVVSYGLVIGACMSHIKDVGRDDVENRYSDPKGWRNIWLMLITPVCFMWIMIFRYGDPFILVGSLFWIVVTYILAKIPAVRLMGGQDARVLISAGLLFPHWLTIPTAFCVGLLNARHYKRHHMTDEERADWAARGIPMVPFFSVGWVVSALVFGVALCFS